MLGVVDEVADLGQNPRRSPGDLLALRGELDPPAPAFDQDRVEARFELLNLY
jgi:hypothetical protein